MQEGALRELGGVQAVQLGRRAHLHVLDLLWVWTLDDLWLCIVYCA